MSKITINILGTTAGVPTVKRAHTAIHLTYDDGEEFCYLFDCGENTQRQMMIAGLSHMKIDGIFITHWHGDHCLGLSGLLDTMGFDGKKDSLTVYAPEAKRIKKATGFTYSMAKFKVNPHNVPSKGKNVSNILKKGRFNIASIPVVHSIPAVAYALIEKSKYKIDKSKAEKLGLPEESEFYKSLKQIGKVFVNNKMISIDEVAVIEEGKKIVYSGDTEICENLIKFAYGADLLIQDCTYLDEEKTYRHAALPEIIKMVEEGNIKKTILTHISRKHKDTSEFKKFLEGRPDMQVAEDFTEIVI